MQVKIRPKILVLEANGYNSEATDSDAAEMLGYVFGWGVKTEIGNDVQTAMSHINKFDMVLFEPYCFSPAEARAFLDKAKENGVPVGIVSTQPEDMLTDFKNPYNFNRDDYVDYILKPADPEQYRAMVRDVLGSHVFGYPLNR